MSCDCKHPAYLHPTVKRKHDWWYMGFAEHAALRSKDPRTKVGALMVSADGLHLSVGFNGFPRGVADDARVLDLAHKNDLMVHAERNALDNATFDVRGGTLYTTMHPCHQCAQSIIQRGVTTVVYRPADPARAERHMKSMSLAFQIMNEVGMELVSLPWSLMEEI